MEEEYENVQTEDIESLEANPKIAKRKGSKFESYLENVNTQEYESSPILR